MCLYVCIRACVSTEPKKRDSIATEQQEMDSKTREQQEMDSAAAERKKMDSTTAEQQDVGSTTKEQKKIDSATTEQEDMDSTATERKKIDSAMQSDVDLKRVHVFLVGEFGTGKTSLKRALLGEEFQEETSSTEAIAVERTLSRACADTLKMKAESEPLFKPFEGVKRLHSTLSAKWAQHMIASPPVGIEAKSKSGLISTAIPGHSDCRSPPDVLLSAPSSDSVSTASKQSSELTNADNLSSAGKTSHGAVFAVREGSNNDPASPRIFVGIPAHELDLLKPVDEELKKLAHEELQKIKDDLDLKHFDGVYVEFWDCGGQLAMASQLSVCIDTVKAAFILTLDASKDLDDLVEAEVFRYQSRRVEIPVLYEGMTHFHYAKMWLCLISTRAQRQSQTAAAKAEPTEKEEVQMAEVIIVATHVDKIPLEQVEERKQKIKAAVNELSSDKGTEFLNVTGPIFVDNRSIGQSVLGAGSEIGYLQRTIADMIQRAHFSKVPLFYLKLEHAIRILQEGRPSLQPGSSPKQTHHSRPAHITFKAFTYLAIMMKGKGMSRLECVKALQYLRRVGAVLCNESINPKDESYIFISPEFLLSKFVQLITCSVKPDVLPNDRSFPRADVKRLKEKGIVTKKLLEFLWSDLTDAERDALANIMCHFDLACEIKGKVSTSSVVSASTGSLFIPFSLSGKAGRFPSKFLLLLRLPPLMIASTCSFFPPAIFNRVAMFCLQEYTTEGCLFTTTSMAFRASPTSNTYACISWTTEGLILELNSSNAEDLSTLGCQLLSKVNSKLVELQQEEFYGLCWRYAFLCECCSASSRGDVNSSSADGVPWCKVNDAPWIELPDISNQAIVDLHKSVTYECKAAGCESMSRLPANLKCWFNKQVKFQRVVSN